MSSDSADISPQTTYALRMIDREIKLAQMMTRPVILTWWLLALNGLFWLMAKGYGMWLVEAGLTTAYLNAEQLSFFTGMKYNAAIAEGQWWRLLSAQFVHLDILHLLFNGYGIYVLGCFFERAYGARRMLVLYIASGTIGSLASYWINAAPGGGASGAVYGLVGGLIVFGVKYRDWLPSGVSRALTLGLVPWVILSLGVGFIDAIPMDNAAHIGGLLTGALVAALMASRFRSREQGVSDRVVTALTVVAAAGYLWMMVGWSAEVTECLVDEESYRACYPELSAEIEEGE